LEKKKLLQKKEEKLHVSSRMGQAARALPRPPNASIHHSTLQ
jgi:hypothetical protein